MTHQSEAILENNLIKQLIGLGYASAKIMDGNALVSNLKSQLEVFNNVSYTDKEFDAILNHLAKGNVFEKAKTLRDRFSFTRDGSTGSPDRSPTCVSLIQKTGTTTCFKSPTKSL